MKTAFVWLTEDVKYYKKDGRFSHSLCFTFFVNYTKNVKHRKKMGVLFSDLEDSDCE